MLLSFPSDKSIEMTFKVGIAGTQTPPTNVAVVLERNGQALSYTATKTGEDWTARIDSPGKTFGTGEVKMCINVLLNNRLFTPLKSMANIVGETAEPVKTAEPPHDIPSDEPKAEIQPEPIATATTEDVKPAVTDEEKKKKVKDLLAHAQADIDKKKAETVKVVPPIRMQLLKSIEPGVKKAKPAPVKESAPTHPHTVFNLKKTKIIFQ